MSFIEFTAVGMFVHLYHIWLVYGAMTSFIYGKDAVALMREEKYRLRDMPKGFAVLVYMTLDASRRDWINLAKQALHLIRWFLAGLTSYPWSWPARQFDWPADAKPVWPLGRDLTLLVGITLGGASRMLTAFYWSEKNRAWMTETNVWIPAIPIVMAVVADAHHHSIAWSDKPWRSRFLMTFAIAWVLFGATRL